MLTYLPYVCAHRGPRHVDDNGMLASTVLAFFLVRRSMESLPLVRGLEVDGDVDFILRDWLRIMSSFVEGVGQGGWLWGVL